jgi:hypothetical protein
MSSPTERDPEALLLELGRRTRRLARELADADADVAAQTALGPLSETETRALIAASLARLETPVVVREAQTLTPRTAPPRRTLLGLALGVGAAAALALVVSSWDASRDLPPYSLSSPRSDSSTRGNEAIGDEIRHYTIGRQLRFVLRASKVADVSAKVALFSERTALRRIDAIETELVPGGSAVVTLTTGASGYAPAPGADVLVFVVGTQMPDSEDAITSNPRLRVLRFPVVWQAP